MSVLGPNIALVGNPNSGKTALFNRLTGSRQKVANYAGVTVERKHGELLTPGGRRVRVLDLPGAYSLAAASLDEAITRDVCRGAHPDEPAPDLLVCVVDATNLRLNLRIALELRALGRPLLLALNMMDAARRRGISIDVPQLARELGVPVVETVAVARHGARALIAAIDALPMTAMPMTAVPMTAVPMTAVPMTAVPMTAMPMTAMPMTAMPMVAMPMAAMPMAAMPITAVPMTAVPMTAVPMAAVPMAAMTSHARPARPAPSAAPADLHAEVRRLLALCVTGPSNPSAVDGWLDRLTLHPVVGLALLAVMLFAIFQAVFAWAVPFQALLDAGVGALASLVQVIVPAGPLQSLLVDGLLAGVGTVLIFLPQILILFLFILLLEESGYLPRAAFLLDRLMHSAGLSGRSFIPLLSSFACAIPGIMATRTITDPRDRLITIMVAPLMTCSARLPVYTLLIAALIPRRELTLGIELQGLVLFALYLAGIVSALVVSAVSKRWRLRGEPSMLLMELPDWRLPHWRDLLLGLLDRTWMFLRRVGTVIIALIVLLWFAASFPGAPPGGTEAPIYYSVAGMLGRALEPLVAPLGFNWQIAVALVPGLAAREVAVAALGTVYALSDAPGTEAALGAIIASQWSLATGLSLLVFYIYAPMCLSTLAVIRRETNSWRQMWVAAGYLFALAYAASFVTYQLASRLT